MKSTRLSFLTAALSLAVARTLDDAGYGNPDHSQPTGKGTPQPRQQLTHLCRPVPVASTGPGLKQLNRKDRRAGCTTARQQRRLQKTIRNANRAALANAFPTEQA